MSNKIFVTILFLYVSFNLMAQEWTVPPDRAKVLSQLPFNDDTRKAGEALFITNCKTCHGDPGKGNSIALSPRPPDPASDKLQKNTDGELFFKIREGRGPMPSFKNTLPTNSIWSIISYFRGFNKQYTQQVAPKEEVLAGKTKILFSWLKEKKQIETVLTNENNQIIKPLEGEEVQLLVVRHFGNLPIDKIKVTGRDGKAVFDFPVDLPGDSTGKIRVNAKLSNETKYGEIKTDTVLLAGIPTWLPPLTQERAMWNVVQKAPLWLLITYFTAVLSIWGFIFYVLYLLRRIYLTGKQKQINQQYS